MSWFNQKANRLNYGELLIPDPGYRFDFGVCCTYTLDLSALLGCVLSLSFDGELDGDTQANPIAQLNGVRQYADRLAVFCGDCSIKTPKNTGHNINNLMDKCVFEVNPALKSKTHKGVFHPKLWIIQYNPVEQPGVLRNSAASRKPYIKVIVLSRNLTFDRSMDYAVELRSEVNEETAKWGPIVKPLVDMLDYVDQWADEEKYGDKRKKIKTLKENVLKTGDYLKDSKDRFTDFKFCPLGIGAGYNSQSLDLFSEKYKKEWLVCVSPFLSQNTISRLTGGDDLRPAPSVLITRKEALTSPIFQEFNEIYGVRDELSSDSLVENEETPEEPQEPIDNSKADDSINGGSGDSQPVSARDIHAKTYMYLSNGWVKMYIGSANATDAAFNQNIEFLLQLRVKKNRTLNFNSITRDLLHLDEHRNLDADSPFERIESIPDGSAEEDASVFMFRELTDLIYRARVEQNGACYNIIIEGNPELAQKSAQIAALSLPQKKVALTKLSVLDNLQLEQLSEFYIIEWQGKKCVKKIPTANIPEKRDHAIINSIIKDQADFQRLVELFISNNPAAAASALAQWVQSENGAPSAQKAAQSPSFAPGLYETMLKRAVDHPDQLRQLDNIKRDVDEEKIPPEFEKLFELIIDQIKKDQKRGYSNE